MTLTIDLNAFPKTTTDTPAGSDLLRRVDRRVASYYLAVPLAGEDDRVTVATAYPDNAGALRMLERLLQAVVVPVAGSEDELGGRNAERESEEGGDQQQRREDVELERVFDVDRGQQDDHRGRHCEHETGIEDPVRQRQDEHADDHQQSDS